MNKPKIAVVGDVMLDKYVFGSITRISPEAPIPILSAATSEFRLGGAANVAHNVAKLGAKVSLFGVIGDDADGEFLLNEIKKESIQSYLVKDTSRPTTTKTRFIAKNQQLLRLDNESTKLVSENIVTEFKNNFKSYDLILVSDYAKGMISLELMDFLKSTSIPIYVDPKPVNKLLFKNVACITPNMSEGIQMSGFTNSSDIVKQLSKELQTTVLLTKSEDGMEYGNSDLSIHINKSKTNSEPVDVTGAGDSAIATFIYYIASGCSIDESTIKAQIAAQISIMHLGCYAVSKEEIEKYEKNN